MSDAVKRGVFVRMFGSAVIMQAVLSATSFIVGLVLIRRTPSEQYGYYVLSLNVISLLVGIQNTFVQPQMVLRMSRATAPQRADLIGGLYRGQRRIWPVLVAPAVAVTAAVALYGLLPWSTAWVAVAGIAAIVAALYREFFRMVLLAYRRPESVLKADTTYALLFIAGATLATLTSFAAAATSVAMSVAAVVGGLICAKALWKFEPWNIRGAPGILLSIAPFGIWSTGSTSIHWLLSQGYNFVVVGALDVTAVAAIAATRLLIMPVNLLSTGIGTMMLPTTTAWLDSRGAAVAFRRLLLIAVALCCAALAYFLGLWLIRDWVFDAILKKHIEHRDQLILLWFAVGLLMILRDQFLYLPLAQARYRILAFLTFASAMLALTICYVEVRHIGALGALIGVLCGELLNVSGLLLLGFWAARRHSKNEQAPGDVEELAAASSASQSRQTYL